MKHIRNFELFLEDINPNTPQGYLNTTTAKKPIQQKQNQTQKQLTPTEEVDDILQNTEDQKQKIVLRKDAIEKGLLNNIREMEPQNQRDVKNQVIDYKAQVTEFDKTVKQIDTLNKTLKKSNVRNNNQPKQPINSARQKNF